MCEEEKNICVLIIDKMFFKHVFVRFQRCFPFDILISLDCRRNAKKNKNRVISSLISYRKTSRMITNLSIILYFTIRIPKPVQRIIRLLSLNHWISHNIKKSTAISIVNFEKILFKVRPPRKRKRRICVNFVHVL